jgi:hypothetical protein
MSIIGIAGLAGSGKTTAGNWFLRNQKNCIRMSFAQPLKKMMYELIRDTLPTKWPLRPSDYLTNPELKNEPLPFLAGHTPRRLMQTLGTEWGRDTVEPDFWVKLAEGKIERTLGNNYHRGEDMRVRIVFDDLRFANEADMVRRYGGLVVRIERPDAKPVEEHASEKLHFDPDVTILNIGTIEDLEEQLAARWPPTA